MNGIALVFFSRQQNEGNGRSLGYAARCFSVYRRKTIWLSKTLLLSLCLHVRKPETKKRRVYSFEISHPIKQLSRLFYCLLFILFILRPFQLGDDARKPRYEVYQASELLGDKTALKILTELCRRMRLIN